MLHVPLVIALSQLPHLITPSASRVGYDSNDRGAANEPHQTMTRADASPAGEIVRVPAEHPGLTLALRHVPPARGRVRPGRVVLFVHGATFPSALAAGYRFDGRSWMDDLAEDGFDVWALDFLGYGESSRHPEMDGAVDGPPLGRALDAAAQIARAVETIREQQQVPRVSIVAHSWGTIPAGLFATHHPTWLDRLILFGPIGPDSSSTPRSPASRYGLVSAEQQRARFTGYVPNGEPQVFAPRLLDPWLRAYLASDRTSASRSPSSVRVPSGASADLDDAHHGELGYDPGSIAAPTLIVRGEWDTVTTPEVATWLYAHLTRASVRRSVLLNRGTHVMHLESGRFQLYREVALFLRERFDEQAASRSSEPTATMSAGTPSAHERISGYTYGSSSLAASPITLEDLHRLEQTATLDEDDDRYLQMAGDVLASQADDLVGLWRGLIGARPHLARVFFGPDGQPDERYKAAIKRRFVQWVMDTCRRPRDEAWLAYQAEIGRRHTPEAKNRTDGAQTPPLVPLRDIIAFSAVVTTTVRDFLDDGTHAPYEVRRMQDAWTKAVMLQVSLWAERYTREGYW
jgi:pimeloyl-ACP methyl ester carboxylesterase